MIYVYADQMDYLFHEKEYTRCDSQLQPCPLMIRPERQDVKLRWYSSKETVACLDALETMNSQKPFKKTHFAFMGDSRVRNQFLNFLQVHPFIYLLFSPFDFTFSVYSVYSELRSEDEASANSFS